MLLDTITGSESERKTLFEVAQRRTSYLTARAGMVSERTPDRSEPAWQIRMVQATLWMEAAECSTMIAEYDDAQRHLRRAVTQLLQLRLPIGAALQRIFYSKDSELVEQANRVMHSWRERVKSPPRSLARPGESAGDIGEVAYDTAQQWAYYALAAGGVDGSRGEMGDDAPDVVQRFHMISAAPVGRFRYPVDHYWAISEFSSRAIRFGKIEDKDRRALIEVISKSLVSLYRSLQWSQSNGYLWIRLLAPVPLFDLDTAMMVSRVLETAAALDDSLMSAILEGIPDEARSFAKEFIDASSKIAPEPKGNTEKV